MLNHSTGKNAMFHNSFSMLKPFIKLFLLSLMTGILLT